MPPIHKMMKFLIAIILVGGLILIFLKFLDGTIINPVNSSLSDRQYQTTQKTYNPGDEVIVYSSAFCKYRSAKATTNWELEDDVLLSYPPKNTDLSPGCFDSNKQIDIGKLPDYIGGHDYRFVGTVTYHLLGRDISVNVSTNYFFVNSIPPKTIVEKITVPEVDAPGASSTTQDKVGAVPANNVPTATPPVSSNLNPPPAQQAPVTPPSITVPILNLRIPL